MKKNKFNIICFLENDQGRDIEQLLGLIYYIEKTFDCEVDFDIKWNAHTIYKKKPDLVLLPNSVGSQFYFDICKYAYESGIKVFALVSEGNFRTNGTFNFWGWYNKDEVFYEEYVCLWSQRTLDYMKKMIPQYIDKLALTGATGFDRYKIYKFKSKADFLSKRNIQQYKKIISYAGWAFGKIYNSQGREEILFWGKNDPKVFDWVEKQMLAVEAILRESIEKNPDILFILKKHPNEANPSITYHYQNEMNRLIHYPNVLYLENEENIHDLINLSDIWIAFESTTVMESWLLDSKKPTLFINPDTDFNRDPTFKGACIVSSYNQLQNYIDEYFSKGIVADFDAEEKENNRAELIKNTIGFGDGLNHLRAGILLEECLKKLTPGYSKKIKFHLKYFIRYYIVKIGHIFYNKKLFLALPRFKKTIWIFEKHQMKNAFILRKKYEEYFNDFYKKNDLFNKVKTKDFREKIMKELKGDN